MVDRGSLQARLNEGIDAVRAGDKVKARRLLQQVVNADPNNEVGWMWLASAVDTPAERRACLQRALKINPGNTRAQEALKRLETQAATDDEDRLPPGVRRANLRPAAPAPVRRNGVNIYLILAGVVLLVLIVLVGIALTSPPATEVAGLQSPTFDGTLVTEEVTATVVAVVPTIDLTAVTATPDGNILVTLDRSSDTRPATFTPTFTPTPIDTATPGPTSIPSASMRVLYAVDGNDGVTNVYTIQGDGTGQSRVSSGSDQFDLLTLDSTGQRVAFVRGASSDGTPTAGGGRLEIFVGPANDLSSARAVTQIRASEIQGLRWSPDGSRLAFSSDHRGNLDIWTMAADGSDQRQLTSNPGRDIDPAWSPDGILIAYASDVDTPTYEITFMPPTLDPFATVDGLETPEPTPTTVVITVEGTIEIYVIDVNGNLPQQFTDDNGSSFQPAWTPDGRQIVFVSNRSGDNDLYVMDNNGSNERLLTFDDLSGDDQMPMVSADSQFAVFKSTRGAESFQLFIVSLLTNEVLPVIASDGNVVAASFFPVTP